MVARFGPWLLPLIGLFSLLLHQASSTIAAVCAVLAAGPLLEALLPLASAAARRVSGLAAVGGALLLPIPFIHRLAVVVAVASMQAFPHSIHRPMVASIALLVVSAPTTYALSYRCCALGYVLVLACWYYDREHGHTSAWNRRRSFIFLVYLVPIIAVGALTTWGLPRLQSWVVSRAVGPGYARRAGFGVVTDLRGISTIKESSAVALRLWAREPRHLRGQVYSRYGDGRWTSYGSQPFTFVASFKDGERVGRLPRDGGTQVGQPPRDGGTRVGRPPRDGGTRVGRPPRDGGTRVGRPPRDGEHEANESTSGLNHIERVERATETSRFIFLPRQGRIVSAPGCRIERNRHGSLFSTTGPVIQYSYEMSSKQTLPTTNQPDYLAVPAALRRPLSAIARRWTGQANTVAERLQAIEWQLLKSYRYSLAPHTPADGHDPVLWFLTKSKFGHCELFASACVLLCRSIGIPARYVTGYSVSELNSLTGYYVARDRDAHAWVEVYLPARGWVDSDPTPPDWQNSGKSTVGHWFEQVTEGAWWFVTRLVSRITETVTAALFRIYDVLGTRQGSAALALVILAAFVLYRLGLWQWLMANRHQLPLSRRLLTAQDEVLNEHWQRFERMFANCGTKRHDTETVDEFVTAIETADYPAVVVATAARFVSAYRLARFRGDRWDGAQANQLLNDLEEHLQA